MHFKVTRIDSSFVFIANISSLAVSRFTSLGTKWILLMELPSLNEISFGHVFDNSSMQSWACTTIMFLIPRFRLASEILSKSEASVTPMTCPERLVHGLLSGPTMLKKRSEERRVGKECRY